MEVSLFPFLILEKAIENPKLRTNLITLFNDQDKVSAEKLKQKLREIPSIDTLKHQPRVMNHVVGEEFTREFNSLKIIPSVVFLDPWGYKGLSLDLINSILQHHGCECIIFFNFNRINLAISNPLVQQTMNELFGETRANQLRKRVEGLEPEKRELAILETFSEAIKEKHGKFVLPFKFEFDDLPRTSHYIIFASKNQTGHKIMKDIMASAGFSDEDDVPTLAYYKPNSKMPAKFEFARPFSSLGDLLCTKFAGQTLTMHDVYLKHNVGEPFLEKHYKTKLVELEKENRIKADPPAMMRQKRNGKPTMADKVKITFPAS